MADASVTIHTRKSGTLRVTGTFDDDKGIEEYKKHIANAIGYGDGLVFGDVVVNAGEIVHAYVREV